MPSHSSQSGFSLIELLVSLTIFTIVITMATGTLLVLLDANAKAQNIQAVINSVTFALDSMSREIRTASGYGCRQSNNPPAPDNVSFTADCTSGGNYLTIIESGDSLTAGLTDARISYYYDDTYYGTYGALLRRLSDEAWYPLTPETVRITDMEFIVTGSTAGNALQPTVTIFVEGEAGELNNVSSTFSMQTSVTQRLIDL